MIPSLFRSVDEQRQVEEKEVYLVEYPGVRSLIRPATQIVRKYFLPFQIDLKVGKDEDVTFFYTIKRPPSVDKKDYWERFLKADEEYLNMLRQKREYSDANHIILWLE